MRKILRSAILILTSGMILAGCKVNVNLYDRGQKPETETKTETKAEQEQPSDIVILFTNDVHCAVDKEIGYAGLTAYRKDMQDAGYDVLLVDDGDEIQGATMGTLTKGDAIIDIMNEVDYDVVIPGNHDFDYGMQHYLDLTKKLDSPVICCNLIDLKTNRTVFDPYIIKTVGDKKIAFVGVTTPTTITASTPAYFEDENGKLIYSFCQSEDGSKLYETVQEAVDTVNAEGVDYTVLISHLGINESDSPYRSYDVIANTTGIDVVLDGHSHNIVEMEEVKNRDGEDVVLSQAGCFLQAIGKLTIDTEGNIKTELVYGDVYDKKDSEITDRIEKEEAEYNEMINRVVGKTDYDLTILEEDGLTRRVRSNETNLADLVTDAYRYSTGADVALTNGGGIRADIKAGDITYNDLINVNPFADELLMRKVTGQELADALEYSVSFEPDEFGGFLQVSGMTFDVDLGVKSQVKVDEDGMFTGFSGDERRVSNILIGGEPIDPKKEYMVACLEYILFEQGNGYTMFKGEKVDLDRHLQDIDSLIEYLGSLNGVVPEEYADIKGQGRIRIKE